MTHSRDGSVRRGKSPQGPFATRSRDTKIRSSARPTVRLPFDRVGRHRRPSHPLELRLGRNTASDHHGGSPPACRLQPGWSLPVHRRQGRHHLCRDAATGQPSTRSPRIEGAILGLTFSPDGSRLVSCGTDRSAEGLRDITSGQMLLTLEGHSRGGRMTWRQPGRPPDRFGQSRSMDQALGRPALGPSSRKDARRGRARSLDASRRRCPVSSPRLRHRLDLGGSHVPVGSLTARPKLWPRVAGPQSGTNRRAIGPCPARHRFSSGRGAPSDERDQCESLAFACIRCCHHV